MKRKVIPRLRFRRAARVVCRVVDGETFLIDPRANSIHHLDALARGIWRLWQRPMSLNDVRTITLAAFPEADARLVGRDVRRLHKEMVAQGLLTKA